MFVLATYFCDATNKTKTPAMVWAVLAGVDWALILIATGVIK